MRNHVRNLAGIWEEFKRKVCFMKKYILLICGLCLYAQWGQAQSGEDRFRFEHLTVNEGLPHSDAMSVVQDNAGFIWVATNDGVARFDGYEIKRYNLPVNPKNGLTSNRIQSLHKDFRGYLWSGAERAGLSFYDENYDHFININDRTTSTVDKKTLAILRNTSVLNISSDRQGHIFAGTREGVFMLTLNLHNELIDIQQISLGSQKVYTASDLAVDSSGTLWIGTDGKGLWYLEATWIKAGRNIAKIAPMSVDEVSALHFDKKGNLWIGANNRIYWVAAQEFKERHPFDKHPLPQTLEGIECIEVDSFGRLWVGTNFGLYFWEAQPNNTNIPVVQEKVSIFLPKDDNPYSINSGRIHQVFEDKNQILWFAASAGGLNKVDLRHKPFHNLQRQFKQNPTLPNNYVNALHKDFQHNWLWIGTRNGFSRYDFTTKTYKNYLNREALGDATGIDVASFCQTTSGSLWVGTRYNGLIRLQNNQITTFKQLNPQLSLFSTSIESIVEDNDGSIWLATFELGLIHLDKNGKFLAQFSLDDNQLPSRQFTYLLYEKEKGILWASTRDIGVLKIQIMPQKLRVLEQFSYKKNDKNSLSVNCAWPLLKDTEGAIWVGTIGGGLNRIIPMASGKYQVQRYQTPEMNVETLLSDEKGNLWIGGSGLSRFTPKNKQWLHYNVADGIQSNSFKVGAACKATDGTLFMGGIKGVTYFRPSQILPNQYAPKVWLTNLRIFNKVVRVGEKINNRVLLNKPMSKTHQVTIHADENDFSIEFVGLNYSNPNKNTYAYRLVGYNDNWIYPAAGQRTASFSNLAAGQYYFSVKVDNGEGRWSEQPATLQITILPPWYYTWWAYLLYLSLIAIGLLIYRKITLSQQELRNTLALEKFKTEKEKEVTDIKLRFFTNVSHELRTPLTLIMGPLEDLVSTQGNNHNKLILMHQQTKKLLDLVNQLLEFRKVEAGHISLHASEGNIIHFLTEIFLIFQLKAEEYQFDYAITIPNEPVTMFFDWSKLEIVLTNLLSNAFKYTPHGGKIRFGVSVVGSPNANARWVDKQLQDNYIEIKVQDWGVGMNPDELNKIFDPYYQASHTDTMRMLGTGIGLSLAQNFVEAHHGQITVDSSLGIGTTFTVKLPFGKAHLSASQIGEPLQESNFTSMNTLKSPSLAKPEWLKTDFMIPPTTRILLVEDNTELRQYLQQLFEPYCEVFLAVDGIEGWEKTLEAIPDLIVSDVMMPNSDGLSLCKKVKDNPKTTHIPVVLLTARVAVMHELEGLETGADEYMAKPFNPKILLTKVFSMLQSRLLLREYYQRQLLLEPSLVMIPDETKVFLQKAMTIVEDNLGNSDFNVQVLVREMAMSQSAFYRQIKAITGQSVVEFIRDIRLKRAAQLLTTSNFRVSEIATMVGIDDIKYFRKMFQSIYKLSPTEYARQHKTEL